MCCLVSVLAKSEGSILRPPGPRAGRGGGQPVGRQAAAAAPCCGPPCRAPGPLPACGSWRGWRISPRHLIKLTMYCYLHADLPGFLSSCCQALVFLRVDGAQSLNAIFVRARCALVEDASVPSSFPLRSIYKALL